MRKRMLMIALASLVAIAAVQAANDTDRGPWKVSLWQNGVSAAEVPAGSEFQIRGAGFHATAHPVKVCVYDRQCQLADPDRGGEFQLSRSIGAPGTYEIWVLQARDQSLLEWRVRAKASVTVTN